MDKMIKLDLYGSIRLQTTNEVLRCIIKGLNEDYTEALVHSSDERICCDGSVELMIHSPLEKSPIRFNGRIVCEPGADKEANREGSFYIVKVYITYIGRMEQRRLSVLIAQKRAFISSG